MANPSFFNPGALLLHAGAAATMARGYIAVQSLPVNALLIDQKGGHLQFLTIQGLAIAFVTMVLSTITDFLPSLHFVHKIKRILFMIALPLAVVISSVYWPMVIFLPHMILRREPLGPEASSSSAVPKLAYIPLRTDLAVHAVPAASLLLDFFLLERKYTKKQAVYGGLIVVALSGLWYGWWVEECAKYNGAFPYPFLTANPFHIRAIIYTSASTFAYACFLLLNTWRS